MKNLNHAGNRLVHINSYSQTHNYISHTDNGKSWLTVMHCIVHRPTTSIAHTTVIPLQETDSWRRNSMNWNQRRPSVDWAS